MVYAASTTVSVEKSEAEIKALLRQRGADAFQFTESRSQASVAFQMDDRRVVFRLPLPGREDLEFALTPSTGRVRSPSAREAAWEQACRSRWRALFLCIKAKLESVESGIETFEQAFMPHILLPDGRTVSEVAGPAIGHAYATGTMPPLLAPPKGKR